MQCNDKWKSTLNKGKPNEEDDGFFIIINDMSGFRGSHAPAGTTVPSAQVITGSCLADGMAIQRSGGGLIGVLYEGKLQADGKTLQGRYQRFNRSDEFEALPLGDDGDWTGTPVT